jgi:imidazolonepropionase-like amidohydrolase
VRTAVLLLALSAACVPPPPGAAPAPAAPSATGDLWIRDVTVVSPERSLPLAHAHVVVKGGRIVSVDTRAPAVPPMAIVEGSGRFLVPGLIDGHVHLAEVPGVPRPDEAAMPTIVDAYFRALPRSYLYFGFTTVVDLNVVDRARVEGVRRAEVGPLVLDCGNGLAVANGYPMVFAPAALRWALYPNFLYDANPAASIPPELVPADHTPEAAVMRVAAGGGVCVKSYYEPGFADLEGKLPLPTADMMRAVVLASHQRKLKVLLHANSLPAHRFALDTGVDATAHGLWNWKGAGGDVAEGLPAAVRSIVDEEVRAGMGVMPTSRVMSGLEGLFVPRFLDDPELAHVLPPELLAWYRSAAGRWFVAEAAKGFGSMPVEKILARYHEIGDQGRAAARYFVAHGGRLLFGSDTPSAPTYANPPGYNGYLEMRELERAGIPPREIFAAATLSNAKFFGVSSSLGTIEAGKRADLLLLEADPLASTSAFDTIKVVLSGGRVLSRDELSLSASPR